MTEPMTREELNRKIAELREPKPPTIDWDNYDPFAPEETVYKEWCLGWEAHSPDGWSVRKDYVADANAALELFAELDLPELSYSRTSNFEISIGIGDSMASFMSDTAGEVICRAWYYSRTGVRVKLVTI